MDYKGDRLNQVTEAMQDAWIAWHCDMGEEDIPEVNPSFNRAWMIQQKAVDRADLRIIAMHSAINMAIEQLRMDAKNLSQPHLDHLADLLAVAKKITAPK